MQPTYLALVGKNPLRRSSGIYISWRGSRATSGGNFLTRDAWGVFFCLECAGRGPDFNAGLPVTHSCPSPVLWDILSLGILQPLPPNLIFWRAGAGFPPKSEWGGEGYRLHQENVVAVPTFPLLVLFVVRIALFVGCKPPGVWF